jgi:hypothetical protein
MLTTNKPNTPHAIEKFTQRLFFVLFQAWEQAAEEEKRKN